MLKVEQDTGWDLIRKTTTLNEIELEWANRVFKLAHLDDAIVWLRTKPLSRAVCRKKLALAENELSKERKKSVAKHTNHSR